MFVCQPGGIAHFGFFEHDTGGVHARHAPRPAEKKATVCVSVRRGVTSRPALGLDAGLDERLLVTFQLSDLMLEGFHQLLSFFDPLEIFFHRADQPLRIVDPEAVDSDPRRQLLDRFLDASHDRLEQLVQFVLNQPLQVTDVQVLFDARDELVPVLEDLFGRRFDDDDAVGRPLSYLQRTVTSNSGYRA